jgi:hypothetical protein
MAQGILQLYGVSDLCVGVLSGAWVGYDDITEDSPGGLATGYIPKASIDNSDLEIPIMRIFKTVTFARRDTCKSSRKFSAMLSDFNQQQNVSIELSKTPGIKLLEDVFDGYGFIICK